MLPRSNTPLTRQTRRASYGVPRSEALDNTQEEHWSTDVGFGDGASVQEPSMSAMRDRFSMRPAGIPQRSARANSLGQEYPPRTYRSTPGPEGVVGQAPRWTGPPIRVYTPTDARPNPPQATRQRHEPTPLRRKQSHDRVAPGEAPNPFVPNGPVYEPSENSAYDRRLAQRFELRDQDEILQPQQQRQRRENMQMMMDAEEEQYLQALYQGQWPEVLEHEQLPQQRRLNLQRNDADHDERQAAMALRIGEKIVAVLEEQLGQPWNRQQQYDSWMARAGSSENNDPTSALVQLLATLSHWIGHGNGNGNGFGSHPSQALAHPSGQSPNYDQVVAYMADLMQRNQPLSLSGQPQFPALQAPGIPAETANNSLELIRSLVTSQTQLQSMVQDLQREVHSLDGGSSTLSSQYAPPPPTDRRALGPATETDVQSLAPAPSSRSSAKSGTIPLTTGQRQGMHLLKNTPPSRRQRQRRDIAEVWDSSDDSTDVWDKDPPARPRATVAARRRARSVQNVERAPMLSRVQVNKRDTRRDASRPAPRSSSQPKYTRLYVEEQQESTEDEQNSASEEGTEWSDYEPAAPSENYGHISRSPWDAATTTGKRPGGLARANKPRTGVSRGRQGFGGGDWEAGHRDEDSGDQYVPRPSKRKGRAGSVRARAAR